MADKADAGEPGGFDMRAQFGPLCLTLTFAAAFVVQLAHHQMWRDEVNAFGLAVASPNLSALLHYVHYEGHPWLWYVMLWCVSRVTVSLVGMKCLQAAIGLGIYFTIGLASPFRWWEKLLLFTSYFISFEYTVMTRMYGVLVLLALLYIRRRALHPDRLYGNAALLGLTACTDLSGMVISFALLCEYVFQGFQEWRALPKGGTEHKRVLPPLPRDAKLMGAAAIYLGLALTAVLSLIPAKDISRSSTAGLLTLATDKQQLGRVVVSYIVKPYFPTVTGRPGHFWIPSTSGHPVLFSLCVPLVLAAYWFIFRKRGSLMVFVGTTCFLMICVGQLIYYGSVRHFGMTFLAFLLGLWMLRAAGDAIRWPAYILLALAAAGGVRAAWGSWQRPFSQESNAANWIVAHGLENKPLVAESGIGTFLQRPVYVLQCACVEQFFLFKRGSEDTGFHVADLEGAARYEAGRTFTYIGSDSLTTSEISELQQNGLLIQPLIAFNGAEVETENLYLYSVQHSK